ncbi:uncharacterized protein LOC122994904 isoform X2 [Thunnus albacares]|uniref:uncharacterized protein LOC121909772 isoform X2 n=1 Tax=Thunnus maccoyii TaxID=8240 RepID=UPI001C4BE046|nr:uncharacterized protein LOC121909772 isoform X2 [Thunnus maccoyii]XP_044225607.1 uncharacterized protein LOC122994904 isoform X2 [Thunnus albacares]
MRTGSLVMHEGPVATLPVQQQPYRHTYPEAVGDLQGQVPLLTQTSNNKLKTMSEPAPLLHCTPDSMASHVQSFTGKELQMANSSPCDLTKPDSKQNGHCDCSCSSDTAPGTGGDREVSSLDCRAAVHINSQMEAEKLKHCEATLPQQKEGSPSEASSPEEFLSAFSPGLDNSCGNHLSPSVSAPEDCSLDLLRIIKHKPSAIVFCDHDCSADNQVIFPIESSDGGESSSSTNEAGEGDDDEEDDDDFSEALQYKEFLVSRRRRNLSRNRKCLRKRQDAQPNSTSGWQKPTNRGKPEFTGSQEEEDTPQNNGKQAAACDSMTLLMKKLDQLQDEIQEVQSANPSHSDVTKADQEQQSTMKPNRDTESC